MDIIRCVRPAVEVLALIHIIRSVAKGAVVEAAWASKLMRLRYFRTCRQCDRDLPSEQETAHGCPDLADSSRDYTKFLD